MASIICQALGRGGEWGRGGRDGGRGGGRGGRGGGRGDGGGAPAGEDMYKLMKVETVKQPNPSVLCTFNLLAWVAAVHPNLASCQP